MKLRMSAGGGRLPQPRLRKHLKFLTSACGLNFGDVDLAHVHHRGAGALLFSAAGGQLDPRIPTGCRNAVAAF